MAGHRDWSGRNRDPGQDEREGGLLGRQPSRGHCIGKSVSVSLLFASRPSPASRPSRQCQCQIRLLASGCGDEHGSAPRSGSDSPAGPVPASEISLGRIVRQGDRAAAGPTDWLKGPLFPEKLGWLAGCLELGAGCRSWPRHCPSPKVPKVALGTSSPVSGPLHHDVPRNLGWPLRPLCPSAPLTVLRHHPPYPHFCSILLWARMRKRWRRCCRSGGPT